MKRYNPSILKFSVINYFGNCPVIRQRETNDLPIHIIAFFTEDRLVVKLTSTFSEKVTEWK